MKCPDCSAELVVETAPHLDRDGRAVGIAESAECKPCKNLILEVTTWPTNREEAVQEIIRTGVTISAMLAVAEAFPLPGEPEVTNAMLERWREADPEFVAHLLAERERYLVAWGKR